MIKHIVFATDFSENSRACLEYVSSLAQSNQAHVTVVNACDPFAAFAELKNTQPYYEDFAAKMKDHHQEQLTGLKQELGSRGIAADTLLVENPAGQAIVEAAREAGGDLIVMGSRGLGTIKSFLLGSVSNFMVHHAPCPVLLVPAAGGARPD